MSGGPSDDALDRTAATAAVPIDVPAGHPGALALALERAPAGAILRVPAGRFRGPFIIRQSVTIMGAGPERTELTGAGQVGVIAVVSPEATLHLAEVTVRDGAAYQGGGLALLAGHTRLVHVVIARCRAAHAGGGIYAMGGGLFAASHLLVSGCAAPQGGGLVLDGSLHARIEDAVIEDNDADRGGGLLVREAVEVRLVDAFVRRNGARAGASALEMRGSSTRAPLVDLVGGALAGGRPALVLAAAASAAARPRLRASGAILPEEARAFDGFEDLGTNTYAAAAPPAPLPRRTHR